MFIVRGLLVLNIFYLVHGNLNLSESNHEEVKIRIITSIIEQNIKQNGRHTLLVVGIFPDSFYSALTNLNFTFTGTDIYEMDEQIDDIVPYHSNTIVLNCVTLKEFEEAIFKVVTLPYWHPLANIILYYHSPLNTQELAIMFYAFWYFKAINVIIIHYNDERETMYLSYFNPYISENYRLDNTFGCWTVKKVTMPISDFDGLVCEAGCHNVSFYSKLRSNNLGTCLGFSTFKISYKNPRDVTRITLFDDKSANFHRYRMNAFAITVEPFMHIKEENGTYTIHKRDGQIWNTISKLMNFTIDISIYKPLWDHDFDYVMNMQEFVSFTQRKKDLVLLPLYQFDVMVVELDNTMPFQDSGVCLLAHRAGFETVLFDMKLFKRNLKLIFEFLACFVCTWLAFIIFNAEQARKITFDQIGKDLVNSFRTVLSISLHKPPKRGSFKIFLGIAIWSFFVLNFSSQAAIISFFSVYKKGKEVDTFEDILGKDYIIEGISSPDVVLPDTEEKFRQINDRMVAVQNMFICPSRMKNDSRRFCLVDCSLGRFMEKNFLNDKGEQYLHILRHDRIHSYYLQMIMQKHSFMTERFSKYIHRMFEAGLINKWIDYRFSDIKDEVLVKPIAMNDLIGIFQGYCMLLIICSLIFVIEIFLGIYRKSWRIKRLNKVIYLNK